MSPATDETQCLERMCDLFSAHEDWLVKRVMFRVHEKALRHTPRSDDSWRESIRGLSDTIFQAIYVPHEEAAGRRAHDPILAFGIVRARMHRLRGVRVADWTELFRVYRLAYTDLLAHSGIAEPELSTCRDFVADVFDRFEAGFREGYRSLERLAE